MLLNKYLYVLCSTEQLSKLAPSDCPHLILQAMAGPLAAATASTVTNPMDVVRARVQVTIINCTSVILQQVSCGHLAMFSSLEMNWM